VPTGLAFALADRAILIWRQQYGRNKALSTPHTKDTSFTLVRLSLITSPCCYFDSNILFAKKKISSFRYFHDRSTDKAVAAVPWLPCAPLLPQLCRTFVKPPRALLSDLSKVALMAFRDLVLLRGARDRGMYSFVPSIPAPARSDVML
jgi:hypothetical protein